MAIAASAALAAGCAALLLSGARSAASFLDPGALGPSADLIRTDFGASAVPAGRTGYDGQQFYAIARFFPHLRHAAQYLDLPRYRLLRIGAPALASLGGRGVGIVVALLALNIVGIGLAVGSVADLAARHGRPSWIGWLAGLPLLVGVTISTPEPLAVGFGLAAVDAADRGRHGRAVVLLVASALVRESGAVFAVAIAVGLLVGRRRPSWRALAAYLLPALAVAAWSVVLADMVGGPLSVSSKVVPLGLLHASGPSEVLAVIALVLAGLGAWEWRDVPAVWPVAAVFGCWILVFSPAVSDWLALPRAAAPALVVGASALGALGARLARPRARPAGAWAAGVG
jgi:hypothetical protein